MPDPKISKSKRRWFRLAAIVMGLLPFVLLEIGLGIFGQNVTSELVDPYVGFSEVNPLFVLNESTNRYEISPKRYPLFQPEQFPATKSKNEFRVFCLGGSTVQGRPFSIETSFTTWLELNLSAADPSRTWNVINCGGVSYASYRLVPILKEVLNYDPDLIVLYTGHNEFLEDRTYQSIKQKPGWIKTAHEVFSNLNTYHFFRNLVYSNSTEPTNESDKTILSAEVEAELDFKNGLAFYHRDDEWRSDVIEHFASNLQQMVQMTEDAKIPMLMVQPVVNLKDSPPFKSEHGDSVPFEIQNRIAELESNSEKIDTQSELAMVETLLKADNQYAALHFRAAHCQLALGQTVAAKRSFLRAKELDICPLRILEPMAQVIAETAKTKNVPIVDIRAFFEAQAPDGIPGRELLVDHVHPTIRGHQLVAEQMFAMMQKQGWVEITNENWNTDRKTAIERHFRSLEFMYFQRGKDRLEGLKRWTRGEVTKERE